MPTDLHTRWGLRLRTLRLDQGLTATDLARYCGISRASVHFYEAGKRVPTDEVRIALAKALAVPVHELFPYDEPDVA